MAKILVVDDDAAILTQVAARLSAAGHAVITAVDGIEATTAATRERPELVILDFILPGANGAKVHERMRRNAEYGALTPVIFFTGAPLEDVRMAVNVDAMTRLLSKSSGFDALLRAIGELLGGSAPSPPAGHGGPHDDADGPGPPEILDLDLEP
ncbi:MAG: response regulator [Elusimicrobia bacterium]|nr:response regulator [Elusimicrobiota bacterium]